LNVLIYRPIYDVELSK